MQHTIIIKIKIHLPQRAQRKFTEVTKD